MAQQRIDMLGGNTGVEEELFKTVTGCGGGSEKRKMKEKEPEEENIPTQALQLERGGPSWRCHWRWTGRGAVSGRVRVPPQSCRGAGGMLRQRAGNWAQGQAVQ